jgi:hypothetical protein
MPKRSWISLAAAKPSLPRCQVDVVQVLADRSASKATSAAECLVAFRSRLRALNAAHNALIAENALGEPRVAGPDRA